MAPKAPFTPPLDDWHYKKGFEIAIKHKEAIRQLHWFGKVPICMLILRYKGLEESSIRKTLNYPYLERRRLNRRGLTFLLFDQEVDKIIIYCL
jgi:hypothetical protein